MVKELVWLTFGHVAACRSSSHPAAVVNHAFPLAGEVSIDKVRVLAADGHYHEVVTEVLQLHPDG